MDTVYTLGRNSGWIFCSFHEPLSVPRYPAAFAPEMSPSFRSLNADSVPAPLSIRWLMYTNSKAEVMSRNRSLLPKLLSNQLSENNRLRPSRVFSGSVSSRNMPLIVANDGWIWLS